MDAKPLWGPLPGFALRGGSVSGPGPAAGVGVPSPPGRRPNARPMQTPGRLPSDGRAGCACRAGVQGAGSAARSTFDLLSSISCEMTRDEIISVFCDARVPCKREKMAVTQTAYRKAGGQLPF